MNLLNLFKKKEELLLLPSPTCTHEWNIFSKTYAPPVKTQLNIDNPSVLEKAIFGMTTYLWECRFCSSIRKEEMLGSDESQLGELFEKVDKFGMQYIKEGDKTYAIARWIPESATTPLR